MNSMNNKTKCYICDNALSNSSYKIYQRNFIITTKSNEAEILVCRFSNSVDGKFLQEFKALKYILTLSTGINHIQLDYCEAQGIKILCLFDSKKRLAKITSSSEFALMLCIMAARDFNDFVKNSFSLEGKVQNMTYSKEISETNFGIIGVGRIGNYVHSNLSNISKSIRLYDPFIDRQAFQLRSNSCFVDKISDLLFCDVILVSCTFNTSTLSLVDRNSLFGLIGDDHQNLKIVNIARGPIVNIEDLRHSLDQGKNISYYLDVGDSYSINDQKILRAMNIDYDNVYCTPHVAWQAETAMRKADMIGLDLLLNEINCVKNNS